MANIHVDYQQLQAGSAQLKGAKEDITGRLLQLKSLVDNLVTSGFITDQASGKFQTSYEQWTTGAKNVIEGLDGMSSFLTTAIAQHQQLDQTLSQQLGS
jgi:WXG100 family type VII secretion target